VLEALNCSLALSRRPSGVALLGVTDGRPTLAACLLPRSMGMAVAGNCHNTRISGSDSIRTGL
jgi:hypothetical protein